MMLDTDNRQQAAKLLLDFYKGRITNDEMVDRWPRDTRDEGLRAVFWGVWGLYDDLHEHYFEATNRNSYRVAKHVHYCLTFLSSDLEYEWRGIALVGLPSWLMEMFNRERRRVNRTGDKVVWPFYRKDDYKRALARVRN
jgi:hypothetical protein